MITFASLFREPLSRVSKWATAQGPLILQARHLHWRLLSSHPSSDLLFVGWTISPERVSSAGVGRRLKCQWFEGHYHTGICFIGELSSQVLSRHKQTPNNQTKQTNKIQTNKQELCLSIVFQACLQTASGGVAGLGTGRVLGYVSLSSDGPCFSCLVLESVSLK